MYSQDQWHWISLLQRPGLKPAALSTSDDDFNHRALFTKPSNVCERMLSWSYAIWSEGVCPNDVWIKDTFPTFIQTPFDDEIWIKPRFVRTPLLGKNLPYPNLITFGQLSFRPSVTLSQTYLGQMSWCRQKSCLQFSNV